MGTSLEEFRDRGFDFVYVIYDADIVGSERDIERMSPAVHMPAGYSDDPGNETYGLPAKQRRQAVAAKFQQTEDDDDYGFAYLGEPAETGNPAFFRAGYTDADAMDEAGDDTPEEKIGQGRHRKWVGELSKDEWLLFADAYYIDLDEDGFPERYEDTMGSITEHGHLFAVSVDNSEGWQDSSGPWFVSSDFYVSFASKDES